MRVILLHPPMYPVNHEFYDMLAKKIDLTVYQIGEYPILHTSWTNEKIRKNSIKYELNILGKGPVSLIKTLNPIYLFGILRKKPDAIISIGFWMPSFYVSLLRSVKRFKFIILTNAIPQTEKNVSYLKKLIRKVIGKNVDIFISASDLTTEFLNDLYTDKNIVLSMQTINVLKWKQKLDSLKSKEMLRKKLHLNTNKKLMLGVGNYEEKKNWKSIIRVLDQIEDVYFVLIGHGSQELVYQKLIEELDIKDKINIIGHKEGNDLLEYYKASDFLIFPSYFDQFGFVVPEALASGLPVICSKNAGAMSLIKNGENGYIVDPTKIDALVINEMILNIDILCKNTQKNIYKYTLENRVNEFVEIINN